MSLPITFIHKTKNFYVKNSGQSGHLQAKWSWLVEIAKESNSDFKEIANCGLRYISLNKQPWVSHKIVNNNCLFQWHLCKPAVAPLFASIQCKCVHNCHIVKKIVLIECKHDMLSHQTFEFFLVGGGVGLDKFLSIICRQLFYSLKHLTRFF